MKKLLGLMMIGVLVFTMVACSNADDLIGTWQFEDNDELVELGLDFTITFTEDTMEMMGVKVNYEVKDNEIVVQGETETVEFKVKGDKLTLIGPDGEEQVLIRVEEDE